MDWAVNQLLQVGQLATPVIALAVLIILLFSIADRHPRNDNRSDNDGDQMGG